MLMFKRINIIKRAFSEHTIIAWMMFAAIVPMLFLAFFAYKKSEATLEQAISNALLSEIDKKSNEVDHSIAAKKVNLMQLSELPELAEIVKLSGSKGNLPGADRKQIEGFSNYLKYITPKLGVSDLFIVSMDGKMDYALYNKPLVGQLLSKDNTELLDLYNAYDGARMVHMPYINTSYNGVNVFGLSIYLSNVISGKDSTNAVLILKLDPNHIRSLIQLNFGYTKSDYTLLGMMMGSKPVIVISTVQQAESEKNSPYSLAIIKLLQRSIAGEVAQKPVEIMKNGHPILAIYSFVPQLNMGMIIEYDKAEVYQKIRWLKVYMIVITLIDLLMVIMIVLWIAGSLREAHRKSERLLENILPKFVADELKEKKLFLARHVDHVSVIFIDIIKFTPIFSSKSPEDVVVILDALFSIFDNLSDKYQLEKIKTIGDSYMAASGLIVPQDDHASRAVNLGLDAIEAVHQYNLTSHTDFAIRVGIDSGNVIAGIIGKKKFSYDLWGNSVNCASRMESTGLPNELQISAQTYSALLNKEEYRFTLRKNVMVKGLGEMDTYLVSRLSGNPTSTKSL